MTKYLLASKCDLHNVGNVHPQTIMKPNTPTASQLATIDPLIDAAVDAALEHRRAEASNGNGPDPVVAVAKRDATLLALLKGFADIGVTKPSSTVIASCLSTAADLANRVGKEKGSAYHLVAKGAFIHECLLFADKNKFGNR